MKIQQIRVGDNFSYVVYCEETRKAALVDPGHNASEAMRFTGHENLELAFIINTHHHRDHTAENARVRDVYGCDIIVSEPDAVSPDDTVRAVPDGGTLMLGTVKLEFLLTPGHTPGSMCILADGWALFTGDTLFIGDCGRTDLPGGSNSAMYDSLQRIKSLPDETVIYPGHDYGDRPFDTLGNQKRANRTLLANSLEEFSEIP